MSKRPSADRASRRHGRPSEAHRMTPASTNTVNNEGDDDGDADRRQRACWLGPNANRLNGLVPIAKEGIERMMRHHVDETSDGLN
jgi:hypothetical protein